MKLALSCDPIDIIIVMTIPYNDDNQKIRDAYENVSQLAFNFEQLGYRPAEHLRCFIANKVYNETLYPDVDYDLTLQGLQNLLIVSIPYDVSLNKYLKRKNVVDTMKKLGDETYENYINSLGIDNLLCQKMEAEKRIRTETKRRYDCITQHFATKDKESNNRPRKYKMSDKPRKPRSDKGMKRTHYNRKTPAN